jgi:hypothetical protein
VQRRIRLLLEDEVLSLFGRLQSLGSVSPPPETRLAVYPEETLTESIHVQLSDEGCEIRVFEELR